MIRKIIFIFVVLISLTWKSKALDVTVNCKYEDNNFYRDWGLSSPYQCEVKNPSQFIGDQIKVVAATGTHKNGKTNSDVAIFKLVSARSLTKIPTNIGNVFKNFVALRIENSSISEISESDIKAFSNLKYLFISHSKIKVIHKDLFKNHPNMLHIVLKDNFIQHIDRDTFNCLRELNSLELHNNHCDLLGFADTKPALSRLIEQIQKGVCQSSEYTTENPKDVEIRRLNHRIEELEKLLKLKPSSAG